jgi:hypothetical protein
MRTSLVPRSAAGELKVSSPMQPRRHYSYVLDRKDHVKTNFEITDESKSIEIRLMPAWKVEQVNISHLS